MQRQFVICNRVGTTIQVIDPSNLQGAEIPASVYWRTPFHPIMSVKHLSEFYVLDVEPLGPTRGKYQLADITVARSCDFGKNDTTFVVPSHLGHVLNPGDTCLGYDLQSSNLNHDVLANMNANRIPDIVHSSHMCSMRGKKAKTPSSSSSRNPTPVRDDTRRHENGS